MKTTFSISSDDGEEIATIHTGLCSNEVLAFLEEHEASRFSVAEYDESDDQIERLNGEEWLNQKTELQRALK